ncbi:MAG TPA: hypothetical protein VMG12_36090 [Polyangiaceae bacterium]|nr:hypothetical protein [Polyangiaceae bacterium]
MARPIQEPLRVRSKRSWALSTGAASGSLILRFIGPTATSDIPEFLAALDQNMPKQAAHLIFDLRELEGHNLDTRAPIQHWLTENRSRIEQVTVLVNKASTIIKMAVSVVGLATGMKLEIRDGLASDSSIRRLRR